MDPRYEPGSAFVPAEDIAVPPRVRELARGAALTPLWVNAIGGVTFRTDDARVIKFGPLDAEVTMAAEAERMRWAARFTPVPIVLEVGNDDESEWLVTKDLSGESAVASRWLGNPEVAVRAVGRGLRQLHDALPVIEAPYSWTVPDRIANAAARGITVPDAVRKPPPIDLLVVCHGDACCPNTVLDDEGNVLAHVDLGALGVADRWADIAVAAMSTGWNYGPDWEDTLIEAYGVEPDRERLAYYRALWNAT